MLLTDEGPKESSKERSKEGSGESTEAQEQRISDPLLILVDEVTLSPGDTVPAYTYEGGLFEPFNFELYAYSDSFFSQPTVGSYEIA